MYSVLKIHKYYAPMEYNTNTIFHHSLKSVVRNDKASVSKNPILVMNLS